MTPKKKKILVEALKQFAERGYAGTSTKRIALGAGVSEGLIFRHFQNKDGLLQAVLEEGKVAARNHIANVVMTVDPRERILAAYHLPFEISKEEHEYWRLMYSIKWQTKSYREDYLAPLKEALQNAFMALDHPHPRRASDLYFVYMDGIASQLILSADFDQAGQREYILNLVEREISSLQSKATS